MMYDDPNRLQLLANSLRGQGYERALPSAMKDDWLIDIGRQMRRLEPHWTGGELEEDSNDVAVPLLLVTHILIVRAKLRFKDEIEWAVDDYPWLFNRFQFLVEREIVARAVGIAFKSDVEQFLDFVDKKIESIVCERDSRRNQENR